MSEYKDFLLSYFGQNNKQIADSAKKSESTSKPHYTSYEDAYFGHKEEKSVEEPEDPSHIIIDEEAEKYVEEHIVDEPEQIIETEVDAYEAAIADGRRPIELQETQETNLVDGPTTRPVEEPDFTDEELEEFKRLNKIEELHENNEPKQIELAPNEVIVTEQPTETKVKKVKISKPKAPKKAGRPKTKK